MSEFWRFSLEIYARPGFAERALDLQDRRNLDVNLLLFCLWAAARKHRLSEAELTRLLAATAEWQRQAVGFLRDLRRFAKKRTPPPDADLARLRAAAKARELDAERIEQRLLEDAVAFPDPPGPIDGALARANLEDYVAAASGPSDDRDRRDLEDLLRAGGVPTG